MLLLVMSLCSFSLHAHEPSPSPPPPYTVPIPNNRKVLLFSAVNQSSWVSGQICQGRASGQICQGKMHVCASPLTPCQATFHKTYPHGQSQQRSRAHCDSSRVLLCRTTESQRLAVPFLSMVPAETRIMKQASAVPSRYLYCTLHW